MEWKLWELALALLEAQLHLFQDWIKGHGALQLEKCNSMQIKPFATPHSLVGFLKVLLSGVPQEPQAYMCLGTLAHQFLWQHQNILK